MADQLRFVHPCCCPDCHCGTESEVADYHAAINAVLAGLDERHRRLFAGLLASDHGHGGVTLLTGLSRTTILRGLRELADGIALGPGRVRRPGGGRPPREKKCSVSCRGGRADAGPPRRRLKSLGHSPSEPESSRRFLPEIAASVIKSGPFRICAGQRRVEIGILGVALLAQRSR